MIGEAITKQGRVAITSDRWHVVHAHWVGPPTSPPFSREIVSEHDDQPGARQAAEALRLSIIRRGSDRPREERDQVFVRPPRYKSLRFARRRETRRP